MNVDEIKIYPEIRDAKTGERFDIFGNGSHYGTATDRYTYLDFDPMGEIYREVIWVDPPWGPPSKTNEHRILSMPVYRNRREMKQHLGDVHVEAYRLP